MLSAADIHYVDIRGFWLVFQNVWYVCPAVRKCPVPVVLSSDGLLQSLGIDFRMRWCRNLHGLPKFHLELDILFGFLLDTHATFFIMHVSMVSGDVGLLITAAVQYPVQYIYHDLLLSRPNIWWICTGLSANTCIFLTLSVPEHNPKMKV